MAGRHYVVLANKLLVASKLSDYKTFSLADMLKQSGNTFRSALLQSSEIYIIGMMCRRDK